MGKGKVKTIGIIGLGSIGMRHKTNLWKELGQTEVVGYDPDPAKQNGTGWVIGDCIKMIEMCDAVVIASPTPQHWDDIVNATMAGKKIFVEKPLAHKDVHAVPENVLMVGYNLIWHSAVIATKSWLDDDAIGIPLWANFTLGQFSDKQPYLRDGVISNWSHEIHLALYLLGAATVITSTTHLTDGKDDISDIALQHDSGCRSTIHLDYVTSPEIRQFIIVGSKATIIADLVNRHAWLRSKDNIILGHHEGHETWNDNYCSEMQAFLDRLEGKKTLGCTGTEALDVLRICLEVRRQAGLP